MDECKRAEASVHIFDLGFFALHSRTALWLLLSSAHKNNYTCDHDYDFVIVVPTVTYGDYSPWGGFYSTAKDGHTQKHSIEFYSPS